MAQTRPGSAFRLTAKSSAIRRLKIKEDVPKGATTKKSSIFQTFLVVHLGYKGYIVFIILCCVKNFLPYTGVLNNWIFQECSSCTAPKAIEDFAAPNVLIFGKLIQTMLRKYF